MKAVYQPTCQYYYLILLSLVLCLQACQSNQEDQSERSIQSFNQKLTELSANTNDTLFIIHLESIQKVINAEKHITKKERNFLTEMYEAFLNDTLANPSLFESYLDRKRMMILAWESPTDSLVSFSWLRLPKNWNKENTYPLYVHLHGRWDVATNPINFMSFTFRQGPMTSPAFEDGYFLSPWARGNLWYHGISKKDIWECIGEFEKIAKVDPNRKYLAGHSMGGYGTWHIAQETPDVWAAIGIHSGALSFRNAQYVTPEYAGKLKDMPVYFVWGDQETELKKDNITVHKYLKAAGNKNLEVTEFEGGHDYNDKDVENMYYWLRQYTKEQDTTHVQSINKK